MYMSVRKYDTIALVLLKKEEERRRMPNHDFYFARCGAYVNLRYIAMLYTHSIGISHRKRWVFKMRDSVPSARYSSVCDVLR